MKCPNCGAEMGEGRLYCEKCGQDIHIVPDFEPELERSIEKSLEHLLEDVAQEGEADRAEGGGQEGKPKGGRFRPLAGWIVLGILTLLLIVGGIRIFQYYSPGYQAERAKRAVAAGQYERAVRLYTRAIELDRFNVDLRFDLAEVYFLQNDKEAYESCLQQIVEDPVTDAEQLESAYGKLIAIYRAREDYQTINDMLLTCSSDSVRAVYQSYLAEAPQFSVPAGEYDEVKALKLTVTGKGGIYYTLNGSLPDERSERYTAPILLENGDYDVRAVFINENGVASEAAEAKYHILVEELEAPELNVDDAEYDTPVLITVLNDTENIYYTTDGTMPTMDSAQYTGPIPMPLGVSDFKFVRLEPGRSSAVVEKLFTLELDTDFPPEQAVDKVRESMLSSGKIRDHSGHFDDTAACYQYQYLYVVNISDINAFYVVAEVFVDVQGIGARTGNYFAVNAYSGYLYKLLEENGEYQLAEL
ncbi:MAG: chitobiase/beta-hexosaminidase C-terminal domain-containing protein [Muribaculum sp.]|nr:chitobiase/beta-hexosaminidase C-terminal domain-containing protein [Muribaculum sp.]